MSDNYPAIPPPGPRPESVLESVYALKQAVELLIGRIGTDKTTAVTGATLSTSVLPVINNQVALINRSIDDLTQYVDTEVATAISTLEASVDAAQTESEAAFTELSAAIDAAEAATTALSTEVDTAITAANASIADVRSDLEAEIDANGVSIVSLQSQTGANAAAITTEAAARATADTALSGQITSLTTTVNGNTASITAEAVARTTADESLVALINTLTATEGGESVTAAIAEETLARTNADSALAAQITSLTTTVNGNTSAISSETTARTTADTALAASITSLTTTVNGNTAAITAETTARSTADTAITNSVNSLTSTVNSNTAAISAEVTARANADTAITASVTSLTSTVNANTSAITSEAATRASADTALSGQITTLTASVGSNAAAITAEQVARANADSGLASQISTVSAVAGRQRVFSQSATPTAQGVSDLWIDTGNGNLIKYWDGEAWLARDDARVASNVAAISTETTARATADTALAASITALTSTVSGNTAAINSEASTRATADTALAGDITSLTSQVSNNLAAIQQEAVTRAAADGAISATVTSVSAQSSAGTAGGKYKLTAVSATGGAAAEFAVEISADGAAYSQAGMRIQVFSNGTSRVVFDTAQFYIRSGSTNYVPFAVTSNQLIASGLIVPTGNVSGLGTLATQNTVSTGQVTGLGTLATQNTVSSGQLTAGLSANVLRNSTFNSGMDLWALGYNNTGIVAAVGRDLAPEWTLAGGHTGYITLGGTPPANTVFNVENNNSARYTTTAGQRLHAYAYLGPHRCQAYVAFVFFDATGTYISEANGNVVDQSNAGGKDLSGYGLSAVFVTAPVNAVSFYPFIRGISANQEYPYVFFTRPFVGLATTNQTEVSLWSPGEEPQYGANNPITAAVVAGLGALATLNTVSTGQVTGLGALATLSTVGPAQLAVPDPGNTLTNGSFDQGSSAGWFIADTSIVEGSGATDLGGRWRLRSRNRDAAFSNVISVRGGETFYVSAMIYNAAPERANLFLVTKDADGGNIQYFSPAFTDVKNTWTFVEGTFQLPAGGAVQNMQVLLQTNSTGTRVAGQETYFGKVYLSRAGSQSRFYGSLESARVSGLGAFATASQINPGNISTYIATAAISDAYIGNISANKVTVSELSAFTANLGTVTAGLARDANSKFIIDFSNSRLTVYD